MLRTAVMDPTPGDDLLTVEEAMTILKCSRGKIIAEGKAGRLSLHKFGRLIRVTRESVFELLQEIRNSPYPVRGKRDADA